MKLTTRRRRLAAVAAPAAVVALLASSCSGGDTPSGVAETLDPDEEVTLTVAWWGDDDRAARYEEALDLFEEQHPNITIQSSFVTFDDYWTARATEAAGSSLPDVMQFDSSFLREYAGTGQLLDVTPYLGEGTDAAIDTSDVAPELIDSGTIEDAVYAVPTATNTWATFYNPSVVEKLGLEPPAAGFTWDDLAAWTAEASEAGAGQDPALYGANDYTGVFWAFLQHLVQEGVTPFTDDGRLGFTRDDMAEWLHSGDALREAGAFFPVKRAKQLEPESGFTRNEQALEMSWDNFLAGYVASTGQDIEMLPTPAGSDGEKHMFARTFQMAGSAHTEHPAAVAALLDFFVNEPEVGRIFGTSKGVPVTQAQRDAMELEPGSVDEKVVRYEEERADDITEPAPIPVEGFGALEAEYKRLGEELAYGNITVDEFVDQWFTMADSQLS
ncbi:extracellular solute-binding protein [Isoptericola sp. 4D.3]|uniref:Extracellular solute-binding protein n=1 Tax=Isoptericola peretonis TaxID=2918523 RepID=A0ABT0J0A6_9MICO|nr:extracellular solute-binding protein [Isoptericola sp. 4D.3]